MAKTYKKTRPPVAWIIKVLRCIYDTRLRRIYDTRLRCIYDTRVVKTMYYNHMIEF